MSGGLRLGVNQPYADDINFAASRTQLDPAAIAAVIEMEAHKNDRQMWDKDWPNRHGSAQGMAQILNRTWLEQAQKPGRYLHDEAMRLGFIDKQDRILDRAGLLGLRFNSRCAITTAAEYSADTYRDLVRRGVFRADASPTQQARDLYLTHFLGAEGAIEYARRSTTPAAAHLRLAQNHQDVDKAIRRYDGDLSAAWHDFVTKKLSRVDADQFRAAAPVPEAIAR